MVTVDIQSPVKVKFLSTPMSTIPKYGAAFMTFRMMTGAVRPIFPPVTVHC